MNFRISLSVSTKRPTGILIKIAMNLYISMENIAILTILNLQIPWISFHFLGLLSLFSIIFYSFQSTSFAFLLLNLFPSIKKIFWCYYKLGCFINFIFELVIDSVWKYSQILCIDLLPCNLAKVISSYSFLINSLGFSTYQIMPSEKKSFISSFLIQMPFSSFSCPIALSKIFITILNRIKKSRHSCLVHDFRGKYSVFHH